MHFLYILVIFNSKRWNFQISTSFSVCSPVLSHLSFSLTVLYMFVYILLCDVLLIWKENGHLNPSLTSNWTGFNSSISFSAAVIKMASPCFQWGLLLALFSFVWYCTPSVWKCDEIHTNLLKLLAVFHRLIIFWVCRNMLTFSFVYIVCGFEVLLSLPTCFKGVLMKLKSTTPLPSNPTVYFQKELGKFW